MRLNVLLLVMALGSALLVVRTHYQSRVLYTELDRAVVEVRRLELEHERLQVDKRAQATSLRVETLAREKLKMRTATPAITQYVTESAGQVAPAAAAADALGALGAPGTFQGAQP